MKPSLIDEIGRPHSWKEKAADVVAKTVGSWAFLTFQSLILILWVIANSLWLHWDPYPFILMNLVLSLQAAYAAPVIMMSQNRQGSIDRQEAHIDYETNRFTNLSVQQIQDQLDENRRDLGKILSLLEGMSFDSDQTVVRNISDILPKSLREEGLDESIDVTSLVTKL